MRTVVRTLSLLLLFVALTSCEAGGSKTGSSDGTSGPNGPIAWPYWPTGMRFHPLTRLLPAGEDEELIIEARVELTDRDGHTSKACGVLSIGLHAFAGGAIGQPIATWHRDLTDPVINRQHYDEVTRTYLLRLEVQPDQIPPRPVLQATLQSADGRELTARFELNVK